MRRERGGGGEVATLQESDEKWRTTARWHEGGEERREKILRRIATIADWRPLRRTDCSAATD